MAYLGGKQINAKFLCPKNLTRAWGSEICSFLVALATFMLAIRSLFRFSVMAFVLAFSTKSIATSGSWSLSWLLSMFVREACNSASTVCCLITARSMASKSKSNKRRGKWARSPAELAKSSNFWSASWSVRIASLWPSRYDCKNRTYHTIVRHFCCTVSYCCSNLVKEQNQYKTRFVVTSHCFWRRDQPIFTLRASVSSEISPPV